MSVAGDPGVRSGTEQGVAWKVLIAPMRDSLNGYARVPAGHPWSGLDYDDIDSNAPGGLTFSGEGWIGFDTAHWRDWWPTSELEKVGGRRNPYGRQDSESGSHQWTVSEIVEEAKALARRVAAAAL